MVTVTHGSERVRVYAEGGLSFEVREGGLGWCVDDEPSATIVALALAARAVAFPELSALDVADVMAV